MAGALAIRRRGGKRPGGRSGECRLQLVGQVGAFPRESIAVRLAAEMAIGGGFAIDRLVEAKEGADALGRQPNELRDQLFDRRLGHTLGREIGRAAGWERVCQYVWIWGVPGKVKKKK